MSSFYPTILFLLGFSILSISSTSAQEKATVEGKVLDQLSKQPLFNVKVTAIQSDTLKTATDLSGSFTLPLREGPATILLSYERMSRTTQVVIRKDLPLTLLFDRQKELKTVEVKGQKDSPFHTQSIAIERAVLQRIPTMGIQDPIKALQILPGVKPGQEGTTGLHVRGGSPDQTITLLDDARLYNISHFWGFVSSYNEDIIERTTLFKGDIPAHYGGGLSSVLSTKSRDSLDYRFKLNLNPILSSFSGQLKSPNEKHHLIMAGRRSFTDVLALIGGEGSGAPNFLFYDVNLKSHSKLSSKTTWRNHLFLSRDRFLQHSGNFSYSDHRYSLNWTNMAVSSQWQHQFTDEHTLNLKAYYSAYQNDILVEDLSPEEERGPDRDIRSNIRDYGVQIDNTIQTTWGNIQVGGSVAHQELLPQVNTFSENPNDSLAEEYSLSLLNSALYVNYSKSIGEKISLSAGLRGGYLHYFDKEENDLYLLPRVSLKYQVNEQLSIAPSYSQMVQPFQQLNNLNGRLPLDTWVTATDLHPTAKATQYALDLQYQSPKKWEVTLSGYYKEMENLLAYKDPGNTMFGFQENWQELVETGTGTAYGAEILLKKESKKWMGMLGYTLSWSNRQFPTLNNGNTFPYTFDRRHDLSLFGAYNFNKDKQISFNFVYFTGSAFTIQDSKQLTASLMPGASPLESIGNVGGINRHRLPAYHRMDISYQSKKLRQRNGQESLRTWSFSLYNLYSNPNPLYIYYYNNQYWKQSGFPLIPMVSYIVQF
ncbi:TonB-dependent receptor [Algivirga pacifica]|uniref:TonB-dependent receptor n=2 Tax=Algivirga pacifica TaxID=1162670 RepID=A0ABP9DDY4_9BACT